MDGMEGCIVEEWLRSLGLVHYTQAFLDNGYDDLEVCKQIGCPDLDAIGVEDPMERAEVLSAVKQLLEEGGTRVYFTLDPEYQNQANLGLSAAVDGGGGGKGGAADGYPPGVPGAVAAAAVAAAAAAAAAADGVVPTGASHLNNPHPEDTGPCEDYADTAEYETGTTAGRLGRAMAAPGGPRADASYEVGRAALVTFPRIQLAAIVRDRAEEDGIDLAQLYQPGYQIEPGGPLDELTKKYSTELKTHYHHVLEALRFQAEMAANPTQDDVYSTGAEVDDMVFSMFSVAGHSHRSVPPPLPSCPPPSTSFADATVTEGSRFSPHHTNRSPVHGDPNCHANEELTELEGEGTLKKRTGLGRFFKNMGGRRSGRKYVYRQHAGDLHASQITMPDEERIELMLLVKEGKLSMHDAVETVKQYEAWKRRQHSLEQSSCQQSPLLDVPPGPHQNFGNCSDCRSSPKVKKVTFSLPLFKLPTLRRKTLLTKQKSLSSADSPVKGRRCVHSSSDYCEPPVEISPDEDAFPELFPGFRADLKARGKRADLSDVAGTTTTAATTYSPNQWISPMLLRRYIKTDTKTEPVSAAREQRRGLFSSPFIKRKGSLDSKVGTTRPPPGGSAVCGMRPSGSFGAVEAERLKGTHRGGGLFRSSSPAFGSGESLREHGKPRALLSTFGETAPVVRETVTVATVHATDDPDDLDNSLLETTTTTATRVSGPLNKESPPPAAAPGINENNRNVNGQCNRTVDSSASAKRANTGHKPAPYCDSTLKIESCVVCNKNEENLKVVDQSSAVDHHGTARDSPDIGIEDTSPTGTLDSTASEDFKDSKYGSSSTMSVGSDVSPVTERRCGGVGGNKKTAMKPPKLQHHHTNSAGEEYMSSDYEDQDDGATKTSNVRASIIIKENCTCKESLTPGSSPRHLPSSPSTMSETSHDTDSIVYSPRRQKLGRKSSKRPRPKTVDELLSRLGIQHLLNVFLLHGYQSLEVFSELEEEDLDELGITQPEDRAKILTAAQLLLDYEGSSQNQSAFTGDSNSLASSQSQSGMSSCDSQHESLLANTAGTVTLKGEKGVGGVVVDTGSSSDELNLQHATISDAESAGDGDEGTLKAAPPSAASPPTLTNGDAPAPPSDGDNNPMVTVPDRGDDGDGDQRRRSTSDGDSCGPRGESRARTWSVPTTAPGEVLQAPDVAKVKYRTSTGTCTSPNLARRSLSDVGGGDLVCGDLGKKSQSSDSAVSSDMDSSSSSPLRRLADMSDSSSRGGGGADDSGGGSGGSPARNKPQRASTGSGQLVKPPKPKVPVRTVSLPAPGSPNTTGCAMGTFRSVQEVSTSSKPPISASPCGDGGKQTPIPAARLGKISSVRDKV